MDDIVITGIGIISACGIGQEAFWQNCLRGNTGIAPIQSFDTSAYRSHLGAEARDFNPRDFMPPLKYRRLSRVSRLAVAASIEALKDSALIVTPQSAPSIGVIIGTGYGSTSQTDDFFLGMLKEGPEGANPGLFPDTVPNAAASQVSIYHGIKGPNTTFSHNEVSGEQAMAYACFLLREGRAEALLVGSVDEMSAVLFHSYATVLALSPKGAYEEGLRPFDRRRNGRVLGEGAGTLVLEKKTRARERGARIYGSLVACAGTGAPVGPARYEAGAEQMARAMKSVLRAAEISPSQVDYICAAANSTPELDRAEALAIRQVFSQTQSIPVSSLHGYIGDFCGSGTLRAAALLLSMRDGKILPTLGLKDPEFDLDHVLEQPRAKQIQYALLNGFSFGGSNVSLLFKNEIQMGHG
jgi:3-oxoacyl-[acyl-carrier-protein] synthase II